MTIRRLTVSEAAQNPICAPAEFARARVRLRLRQADLAALFGVSVPTVQRWESTGAIPTPAAILMRLLVMESAND